MGQKYTAILIPDDEGETKRFRISGFRLKSAIASVVIFLTLVVGLFLFYVPQAMKYDTMKKQYELFAAERTQVLELSRDLQRLQQMDKLIRSSLGTPKNVVIDTTTDGFITNQNQTISYIDNIPSVPPVLGYISQRTESDLSFIKRGHYGVDIVVKEGEPIQASAAGLVVFSDWTYDQGNVIILYHGDGYFTHYGHNQKNLKSQRDIVARGEVIALSGNTGNSSGPHLHYEIWKDGVAVDPLDYFPAFKSKDLTPKNG
ncbi:MAG: M23 family metallopeptidase [Candidatus Marinimicrobia bacterium]|nr:M23 family metallopeptidase [Candidatus Neomarinimicrobiota bacterium]